MYVRLPPDDAIDPIVRPAINVPPVQPGEGIGESSDVVGIAGAPAAGIAAAPAVIDIVEGIADAPAVAGVVVCGVMLALVPAFIDAAGIDMLGAFAPALLALAAAVEPAAMPLGIVVEGVAAVPAAAAGIAAVGGCIAGPVFEPLPLQAAPARMSPTPNEAPSHETRAGCTWSSITPLLSCSRSERRTATRSRIRLARCYHEI